MSLKLVTILAVLAPLAACASQVDSEHQGDSLAKISGSVRNTRTLPIQDGADVVVLWHNSSGSPDLTAADTVEVDGSFPAQFTLSIYQPPQDALLNDWNGVKVGVAYIIAGVAGTDYSDDNAAEAGLLGMEENHLLVYVPQAVPAGSAAALLLRSTPGPGFHLYGVRRLTDAEQQTRIDCIDQLGTAATGEQVYTQCGGEPYFDDLVPLPTDLATPLQIDLVDDLEQIDPPNWT